MTTPPVTNTDSSASGASTASTVGDMMNGSDFMQLLVAQLKNQDPTNPMDPTQMVNQLVQFNSLETMLGMKQDLDAIAGAVTTATTPAG